LEDLALYELNRQNLKDINMPKEDKSKDKSKDKDKLDDG